MSVAEVIQDVRSQLGKPYVLGAEGPDAFDCSGLMQWAYGRHGVKLPRLAEEQAKVGQRIPIGQQKPGDLIFTTWDASPDVDHVALFIGDGKYISAPHSGDVVKIGTLNDAYVKHITNIQRVSGGPIPPDGGGGGGGNGTPLVGGLIDAVNHVAQGVKTAADGATAVGNLAQKLMWFALPTSQVRIISGVLGVGFLLVGVRFLVKEVRA